MCSVHNTVDFEKRGIPATIIITEVFKNAADFHFKGRGMPGHPYVTLPHPVYFYSPEEMGAIAVEHLEKVVGQVTE